LRSAHHQDGRIHSGRSQSTGFTSAREAGYDLPAIRVGGFTAAEFKAAGCDWPTIKSAGFTALQAKDAGCSLDAARAAGFDVIQLVLGFGFNVIVAAGIDVSSITLVRQTLHISVALFARDSWWLVYDVRKEVLIRHFIFVRTSVVTLIWLLVRTRSTTQRRLPTAKSLSMSLLVGWSFPVTIWCCLTYARIIGSQTGYYSPMVMRIASTMANTMHNAFQSSVSVRIRSVIQRDAQIRQGAKMPSQMYSGGIKSGNIKGLGENSGCTSQETGVMLQYGKTKKMWFLLMQQTKTCYIGFSHFS
jgi:hypothetical protein